MHSSNDTARGLSVFVLEDEALVVMNLEDMLDQLGCSVIGPAMRLDQANRMLDTAATADVAILDVNIGGDPVFPFAEALEKLGVPLIFATGYGRAGLPSHWQDRPVLPKPYTMAEVEARLLETRALAIPG